MPRKGAAGGGSNDDFGPGAKSRAQKEASLKEKGAAASAKKAAAEDEAWAEGSNSRSAAKKAEEERAKAERAARKAEADAQLRAEEDAASKEKLRGAEKVAARKTAAVSKEQAFLDGVKAPTLEARGIDAALAVLTIASAGGGGATGGASDDEGGGAAAATANRDIARAQRILDAGAGGLVDADDKHPEKRAKAAYARYRERELPLLKKEYPSLRMSQHVEMLDRAWKKSPENPIVAAEKLRQLGGGGN